jgi:hypothetical protein
MPALPELQRAFGAALLAEDAAAVAPYLVEDGFSAAERLRIHRNGCRSTLTRSLRMTYPALERLVGAEFFDAAAQAFIAAHPPASGCLNDYGGEFAEFLEAFHPARPLAYLGAVARFEWALGVAANAPDVPALDVTALAALAPEQHARLRFAPHPSVRLLALRFPADEIADAVMSGDEAAMAEVDLASGPVRLVVHRGPDGVAAQRLSPQAHGFLSRLFAGEPLGTLLEAAPADAPQLLAEALAKGRLSAFQS